MSIEELNEIDGLRFEKRWRADNGEDSYVVPYATVRPTNIVYHGESKFDYGHYGVHLGQEDRLTFLGCSHSKIRALFLDCRVYSKTRGCKIEVEFGPSSARTLCIPPGVAHTFLGLENVFTINDYNIYLPPPENWVDGNTEWDLDSDIINIPVDIDPDVAPSFVPNKEKASNLLYRLVAEQQRRALSDVKYRHAETETVRFMDGSQATLSFREPFMDENVDLRLPDDCKIPGVSWKQHFYLSTGKESGIVPLLDPYPMYVVDHGGVEYSHDAFGIHIGQEDRLTFLGRYHQKIKLVLLDCRRGSPTLHNRHTIEFYPDPRRYLIIPNGVAHAFMGLENVFTVNRPAVLVKDWRSYDSSNDVIDWPLTKRPYPVVDVHAEYAPQEFYNAQALAQSKILSSDEKSTPIVLTAKDSESGKDIRISMQKNG